MNHITFEVILQFVTLVFIIAVIWSYGQMSFHYGVRSRLHVTCMIWSYLIVLMLVVIDSPTTYMDWKSWAVGVALLLGTAGIVEYYREEALMTNAPVNGFPWWVRILDRYGTPTLILICVGFGVFRIAGWAGPKFDRFFEAHVMQMQSLSAQQAKQSELMGQLNNLIELANDQRAMEMELTKRVEVLLKQNRVLLEQNQTLILEIRDRGPRSGED